MFSVPGEKEQKHAGDTGHRQVPRERSRSGVGACVRNGVD